MVKRSAKRVPTDKATCLWSRTKAPKDVVFTQIVTTEKTKLRIESLFNYKVLSLHSVAISVVVNLRPIAGIVTGSDASDLGPRPIGM